MRVTADPTVGLEGVLNVTAVGTTAVTLKLVLEVALVPLESMTLAVSQKLPATEGVQVMVYGEEVTVAIIVPVPPDDVATKN